MNTTHAFVFLTDPETRLPLAVRVDQIVAVVPFHKGLDQETDHFFVSLLTDEHLMVSENAHEVLDLMARAFKRADQ